MSDIKHWPECGVWQGATPYGVPDESKDCTCGARKAYLRKLNFRAVPPLNMTDDEFLRTMRIKPETE